VLLKGHLIAQMGYETDPVNYWTDREIKHNQEGQALVRLTKMEPRETCLHLHIAITWLEFHEMLTPKFSFRYLLVNE
jgi:hypothetical protein